MPLLLAAAYVIIDFKLAIYGYNVILRFQFVLAPFRKKMMPDQDALRGLT